jgi:hypothetical protein
MWPQRMNSQLHLHGDDPEETAAFSISDCNAERSDSAIELAQLRIYENRYQHSLNPGEDSQASRKRCMVFLVIVLVTVVVVGISMVQNTPTNQDSEEIRLPIPPSKLALELSSHLPYKSDSNFLPEYTLQSIFQQQDSPQKKALEWLQQHPEFTSMPAWRKQQRIALATLLVSQSGQLPLSSDTHECDRVEVAPHCDEEGHYLGFHLLVSHAGGNTQWNIPRELGLLTLLTKLQLQDRDRLVGTIPTELGELTALSLLSLQGQQLSGTLPTELGRLTKLEELSLFKNQLSGTLPSELGQLTALVNMIISNTNLQGKLPKELAQLNSLSELHLGYNHLSGSLPSWLSKLSRLTKLKLGVNRFTGSIPQELGDMESLVELSLESNQLHGKLPRARWSNLSQLELFDNQFDHSLPSWFGAWSSLEIVSLHQNQWTGSLPSIEPLKNLQVLKIHDNVRLRGSMPDEACYYLVHLSLVQVDCERVTCTCKHCKCSG